MTIKDGKPFKVKCDTCHHFTTIENSVLMTVEIDQTKILQHSIMCKPCVSKDVDARVALKFELVQQYANNRAISLDVDIYDSKNPQLHI
jgi:hypothetical protein